jgi:hypothetical protein
MVQRAASLGEPSPKSDDRSRTLPLMVVGCIGGVRKLMLLVHSHYSWHSTIKIISKSPDYSGMREFIRPIHFFKRLAGPLWD